VRFSLLATTALTLTAAATASATAPRLGERPLGQLASPLQDTAAAPARGGALLAGGLDAAGGSTDGVRLVVGGSARTIGRLPAALHDATAVRLGRFVYYLGGGSASQVDGILRLDPASGRVKEVGRLPEPNSDLAAAAVGGTIYVVGGYTGSRWLDTILAWRPGEAARVVGHLPYAVRYAAVAAVAGRVVIAGGSLESGTATDEVLVFDPKTGTIRRIGRLPAPTTHGAAAPLGHLVYVIGGRGATKGTPTAQIVAVDPLAGRVEPAGALASARSDLAAVPVRGAILLAGGRDATHTLDTLAKLAPR